MKNKSSMIADIIKFIDIKSLLVAVFVALMFRAFILEPYKIPSGSMFPTLMVGDRLFISKFSYGYSKYSVYGLPISTSRIFFTEPKRGDVIIFKLPSDVSTNYIKRLVGLPGDEIQIIGGNLYINNRVVERKFIGKWPDNSQLDVYNENLDGVVHQILLRSDLELSNFLRNTVKYIVPADHYFFMGDNRDNSIDSRFESVGFVPKQNLLGRALFLFWTNDMSMTNHSLGRNFSSIP